MSRSGAGVPAPDPLLCWKGRLVDAVIKGKIKGGAEAVVRPSRDAAEEAVRTLIAWAGDDPRRPGLIDTPQRVVDAYEEWFAGYRDDPIQYLSRTFDDVGGYDDMVMLRDIEVESHCEHHIAPFLGQACVAYLPTNAVVGISKLARVVEIFAKRLQTQETMTTQIAQTIELALKPRGVAVFIDAKHQCMTTRGVHHPNVSTITTHFMGEFRTDRELRERFLRLAGR
ncbi:GTP cyclohydrolase I FolE [bacterium]|nr:GTP cyclohydrolase I FolE [bacterium]